MSNRNWSESDIMNVCSEKQPMSADQIREALEISPHDKRECFRLGETLQYMGNAGKLTRNKQFQTYTKPKPTTK